MNTETNYFQQKDIFFSLDIGSHNLKKIHIAQSICISATFHTESVLFTEILKWWLGGIVMSCVLVLCFSIRIF